MVTLNQRMTLLKLHFLQRPVRQATEFQESNVIVEAASTLKPLDGQVSI